MKMLIETYIDVIIIALISLISVQFICINLEIQNAKSYHQNVIEMIESSNANSNVIQRCKNDATSKYGANSLTVTNCTEYDDRISYYVQLKYDVTMPLTGITKTCTAEGYAR